jgi:acetyltransferase-like isoleucine patch superfamily enzyme
MKESVTKLLVKYSWVELSLHGMFVIKNKLLQLYSGFVFKAKCFINNINVGTAPKIWGKFIINKFPGSRISIGKQLRVVSNPSRYSLNVYPQSKLRTMTPSAKIIIGDNVSFNSISITARSQTISIGNGALIGGNCQIMDSDFHPAWPPEGRCYYPGTEHDKSVIIGTDVFIGINVLILKGVTIGNNSVIAAGSVVVSSIPQDCLAAGVPAKVIKRYK